MGVIVANIFWRLWRGQYPLVIAFWIFYVAGYVVSYLLLITISPLFHTQPWRLLVVILLIVPYNVIFTVGVWRSAKAYPFTRWWPILAQIAVVLWEFQVTWSMANGILRALAEMAGT